MQCWREESTLVLPCQELSIITRTSRGSAVLISRGGVPGKMMSGLVILVIVCCKCWHECSRYASETTATGALMAVLANLEGARQLLEVCTMCIQRVWREGLTGLCACCRRYGLCSFLSLFVYFGSLLPADMVRTTALGASRRPTAVAHTDACSNERPVCRHSVERI
jgi:hypothetical protein